VPFLILGNMPTLATFDMLFSSFNNYQNHKHCFTAILQVNLHQPAPPVKNWRILLVQSFTVHMPLLMAISVFRLGRYWSSPQQCHLHCVKTFSCNLFHVHGDLPKQVTGYLRTAHCKVVHLDCSVTVAITKNSIIYRLQCGLLYEM